jgi:very-short-patch-repair endonuclease
LPRQRMDFLLQLPRRRVVLEINGIQHYADDDRHASPARYAEMVAADRELRLAGYEVYRFGGHEIADRRNAAAVLDKFFDRLLAAPDPT